jgi:hypothetical protein
MYCWSLGVAQAWSVGRGLFRAVVACWSRILPPVKTLLFLTSLDTFNLLHQTPNTLHSTVSSQGRIVPGAYLLPQINLRQGIEGTMTFLSTYSTKSSESCSFLLVIGKGRGGMFERIHFALFIYFLKKEKYNVNPQMRNLLKIREC